MVSFASIGKTGELADFVKGGVQTSVAESLKDRLQSVGAELEKIVESSTKTILSAVTGSNGAQFTANQQVSIVARTVGEIVDQVSSNLSLSPATKAALNRYLTDEINKTLTGKYGNAHRAADSNINKAPDSPGEPAATNNQPMSSRSGGNSAATSALFGSADQDLVTPLTQGSPRSKAARASDLEVVIPQAQLVSAPGSRLTQPAASNTLNPIAQQAAPSSQTAPYALGNSLDLDAIQRAISANLRTGLSTELNAVKTALSLDQVRGTLDKPMASAPAAELFANTRERSGAISGADLETRQRASSGSFFGHLARQANEQGLS